MSGSGRVRIVATLGALVLTAALAGLAAPSVSAAGLRSIGGSWSAVPALPAMAAPMALTTGADGRLYLFGFCEDTSCPQRHGAAAYGEPTTYVFDPADWTWHTGASAPDICSGAMAAAARPDGKIELAGCWHDMVTDAGFRVAVYDPASATWTLRRGHGAYVDPIEGMTGSNGAIYWFAETLRSDGSAVFFKGYRVVVEIAGQYALGATAPLGAASDAAVLGGDGRVYALGGARACQPEFGTCPVRPVRAWQPLPDAWATVTNMPTPRMRVAAATDSSGRIFVMGGISGDGSTGYATVEVYRPASDSWRRAPDLAFGRMAALATATSDGRVWLIGGYDTTFGSPLFDGEVYTPAG